MALLVVGHDSLRDVDRSTILAESYHDSKSLNPVILRKMVVPTADKLCKDSWHAPPRLSCKDFHEARVNVGACLLAGKC